MKSLGMCMVEEEHVIQTDLFVYTRFRTREIYVPGDSQETSLQTHIHIISLEAWMVKILTDLSWK